jgi:hypothetical protein
MQDEQINKHLKYFSDVADFGTDLHSTNTNAASQIAAISVVGTSLVGTLESLQEEGNEE